MKKIPYLLIAVILLQFSCRKDNRIEKLQIELESVLNERSNGDGLSYYQLPDGDDLSQFPQDPANPLNKEKIELGKLLFHETALGNNPEKAMSIGKYSCATCHFAKAGFQAGIQQGIGEGGAGFGWKGEGRTIHSQYTEASIDVQPVRTPSILNIAFQKNILWNGQFGATDKNVGTEANWIAGTPKEFNQLGYEGTEIQAIAGLQVHRMGCDKQMMEDIGYKTMFDEAFPGVPETERYNKEHAGLAIAAYERTVVANKAPFQRWLRGDYEALSKEELEGAILFFEKAQCGSCHTGPALNSMSFHALGFDDLDGPGVYGNDLQAIHLANLGRGGFTGNTEDNYKFKVPQLYNLKDSPFYGHGGNFYSVADVIKYKNRGVAQNPDVASSQLSQHFQPLGLSEKEISKITTFIVESLYDSDLMRFEPDHILSGNCFPNGDEQSMVDLDCK